MLYRDLKEKYSSRMTLLIWLKNTNAPIAQHAKCAAMTVAAFA
jgi:hypothetical protein